jgi:cytoskeleton protein RodZ
MNDNRAKVMDEINEPAFDKPSAESTSSDKPNLTLLEKGQNPGAMLKAAREKLGLSISEVSARTKINERQIEALESGDLSILPPATFAKAFIKSYSKVVKLDHVPVISAFGFPEAPLETAPVRVTGRGESLAHGPAQSQGNSTAKSEPFEPKMPSSSKRLSAINFDGPGRNRSVGYFVVLGLAVLGAVFYLPAIMQDNSDKPESVVQSEGQGMPPPVAETQAPKVGGDAPVADAPQLSMSSQLGTVGGSQLVEGTTAPSSQVAPAALPGASVPAATSQATAPVTTTPSAATAAGSTTVATAVQPNPATPPTAVVAQPATLGQSSLKFSFVDQSWVTVRDANNSVLMSQLNQPGSNIEVVGQGPFKVIVGNAKAVTLSHNGKPVELNSSIRGEVARLTIQ